MQHGPAVCDVLGMVWQCAVLCMGYIMLSAGAECLRAGSFLADLRIWHACLMHV